MGFIHQDPPEHDHARQIMNHHYGSPATPGRIDGMRPDLLGISTGLIDRLTGKAEVDLKRIRIGFEFSLEFFLKG